MSNVQLQVTHSAGKRQTPGSFQLVEIAHFWHQKMPVMLHAVDSRGGWGENTNFSEKCHLMSVKLDVRHSSDYLSRRINWNKKWKMSNSIPSMPAKIIANSFLQVLYRPQWLVIVLRWIMEDNVSKSLWSRSRSYTLEIGREKENIQFLSEK